MFRTLYSMVIPFLSVCVYVCVVFIYFNSKFNSYDFNGEINRHYFSTTTWLWLHKQSFYSDYRKTIYFFIICEKSSRCQISVVRNRALPTRSKTFFWHGNGRCGFTFVLAASIRKEHTPHSYFPLLISQRVSGSSESAWMPGLFHIARSGSRSDDVE